MKVLKVKRTCGFCKKEEDIDYKNLELLGKYISSKGKIHSRRVTNICAKHQRKISREIKRARILGLLPFKAS
ncbi:MAG: 30S ribosomal protein S18 [Candidatus Omnitrophica bacterium]|nr:30S ribosomal protein S18 [Candidatus Omnitrophota bacterium]MDD5080419.1 30S ribosomal protein S18 [Candidatus Omnitrophota bacterium]MDD5441099.1 30S ribosomal protein S18 [Candidatus Omnitrophota bacterium]